MCSDVFAYENMKSICFICCGKGSTWQNRVAKAKLHPAISLTFLSHPHPTVMYLLEVKSMFAFFWLLFFSELYFWILVEKELLWKQKKPTNHNYCFLPLQFLQQLQSTEECWSEKCYSPGVFSYSGVPWLNWERACQRTLLKGRKSFLKRRLHLLTVFLKEDFVFYLL